MKSAFTSVSKPNYVTANRRELFLGGRGWRRGEGLEFRELL